MRTARRLLLLTMAALALAALPVQAADAVTYLGKPTNDVPQFVPLGGFMHKGPKLRAYGLPQLLFIGTQEDARSATERWAVVKALDQFGILSGVTTETTVICDYRIYQDDCVSPRPTFNWAHARYRSRYLVFEHKDLLDRNNKLFQKLTSVEMALFRRYAAASGISYEKTVLDTAFNRRPVGVSTIRHFPLISIGGYVQTGNDLLVPGDFINDTPSPTCRTAACYALSFGQVKRAMVHNSLTPGTTRSLTPDINTEANVITALICQADGGRPKLVCGRKAIRRLTRHAR